MPQPPGVAWRSRLPRPDPQRDRGVHPRRWVANSHPRQSAHLRPWPDPRPSGGCPRMPLWPAESCPPATTGLEPPRRARRLAARSNPEPDRKTPGPDRRQIPGRPAPHRHGGVRAQRDWVAWHPVATRQAPRPGRPLTAQRTPQSRPVPSGPRTPKAFLDVPGHRRHWPGRRPIGHRTDPVMPSPDLPPEAPIDPPGPRPDKSPWGLGSSIRPRRFPPQGGDAPAMRQ